MISAFGKEMKAKKYIYIVQVTRQLSIDIINSFAGEGKEIHLITGLVESNYKTLHPSVRVNVFNKYDNRTGFKRLLTWSLFTMYSFFYLLFSSRKNELILVTTPPFIIYIGMFFKKIRNQKYHLIIWDLYPDVLVNFGVFKNDSFIINQWKRLNKSCFNNASSIFTLGNHIADTLKTYTDNEIKIVQNWVDAEFVKPMPKSENPFAVKHALKDKFVVMYSGNLGMTHNIESMLEAASLLKQFPHIVFVIIGDGAKKEKIERMVQEQSLTNVITLPYQDKAVLPYSLASADIGMVTLDAGAENISVPSKTYYMLAAGTLILALASKQSELGFLIEKYRCGKVFDNGNASEIAAFIKEMSENAEELLQFKKRSREASYDFTPLNAKAYFDYICRKQEIPC